MAKPIAAIHFVDAVTFDRLGPLSTVTAERQKLPMTEDAIGVIVGNERVPWSNVKQVRYAVPRAPDGKA